MKDTERVSNYWIGSNTGWSWVADNITTAKIALSNLKKDNPSVNFVLEQRNVIMKDGLFHSLKCEVIDTSKQQAAV